MKLTMGNILQLYMVTPVFLIHTYAYEFSMFKRHLNDSRRLSGRYQTLQKLSLMSCCTLCHYDKRCNGVSYQEATRTCELSDKNIFDNAFDPQKDGAWVAYTMMTATAVGDFCETDTDCRINNSKCIFKRRNLRRRCVCNDRFKFDKESHTCVQDCELYGTTFTLYTGKTIVGLTAETLSTKSVEECRALCLSLDDRCRSFVMVSKKGKCLVKAVTMQQAIDGHLLSDLEGNNLYVRDCE